MSEEEKDDDDDDEEEEEEVDPARPGSNISALASSSL